MNIFAGSRRIALLAGSLVTIPWLIVLANPTKELSNIEVPVLYSIHHPGGPFTSMTDLPGGTWCPSEAGHYHFHTTSRSGRSVSVNLCLLTTPFREDARSLENRFVLSPEDEDWVEKSFWHLYRERWKDGLGYLAIALAVFAGFIRAVGWVVRGFMGIPSGMDKKTE